METVYDVIDYIKSNLNLRKGVGLQMKLIAMKLFVFLLCGLLLSGCSDSREEVASIPEIMDQHNLKSVQQVGQIPDEFKGIVENNIFSGICVFDGRLLKSEICAIDDSNRTAAHQVRMMDLYGNDLAVYPCNLDDAYYISTLTATADGGFLFVLGFEDYALGQDTWASDQGFASRVIKCDKDVNLQFDTSFDRTEGSALSFCFEVDGKFYFFGTIQTPETKTRGVHSPTDISMIILDQSGAVLENKRIAGSDYDSLLTAELTGKGFLLSLRSQSDDGDFTGSDSGGYPREWVVAVNSNLEITEKRKASGRSFSDDLIGKKDGVPIYQSDDLLKGFDAGTPTAFIDYGDFYLIVSHNNTGIYEKTPPQISSIWYYAETVYSAYDRSGELIFRASVDSSPDYDAFVESFNQGIDSES
jgi:hypothetical protein